MLVELTIAALIGVSAAQGAPVLPSTSGLLGPDGVQEITLADYPDMRLVLLPGDGGVELRRPDGRMLRDGQVEAGKVFSWGQGSDRRLIRADDAGRIQWVTWGSGRLLQVNRNADGAVTEVLGPGGLQTRVSYDGGFTVEHPLGLSLAVTGSEDGWWTVRDGTSRQTRMLIDPQTQLLVGWEDPRGLRTRIREHDGQTELVGPGGDVWRTASEGLTGWMEQPDGHRWSWTRDATGAVTELRTPSGQRASWLRDEAGRVQEALYEGRRHALKRDSEGRLVRWTDPSGAELRLEWSAGAVTRVVDAGGAAVVIERDEAGRAEVVHTRSGGTWSLDRGLDGELSTVVDPVGRTLSMRRNGAGRVTAVTYGGQITQLMRDSAGRVASVVAASGARTGFVRDASGRIRKVRQPGRTLSMDRDAAGDLVAVKSGGVEVLVQRDVRGRVVAAGPMRWVRDLLGQVRRLVSPAVDLRLERDILGRVRELMAGGVVVSVQRGPGGQPVRWTGGGTEVNMVRDAAGRPVAEEVGDRTVRLERGARGHKVRADGVRGTWRWSRGADADVLRVEGPDGVGIGVDRDPAGRVVLGRLPGGGISKRSFVDDEVVEAIDDAGGGALARGVWLPSAAGGVAWAQADDGLESSWQRDGRGDLLGVEVASQPSDSWLLGAQFERGADGWTRALDSLGRTTDLSAGDRWPAWGAVGGSWAYHRDRQGRLQQVAGADGGYQFEHDPFGRLLVVQGRGATWSVQWDAMGRPHRILRPGHVSDVVWAPGQVVGTPLATGRDGATAWLDSGTGVRAWSRASEGGRVASAGLVELPGIGRAYIEDALGVIAIRRVLGGAIADSAAMDPIGHWGGISLFTGGPELMSGVALEPAALDRTDGTIEWPWGPRGQRPAVLRNLWDASAWDAEVDWGDPLSLARSLGVVDVPAGQGTLPGDTAVPWLPASLDQRACPVGPAPGYLGLEEELDPLVWRIIVHLANTEGAIDWDTVAGPLIDPAEVGRLPPGLRVPGLHNLDAPPDQLQHSSLEQKVLASWSGLL